MDPRPAPVVKTEIRIINAALDETTIDGKPRVILRGVVEPADLPLLKVDDYQREAKSVSRRTRSEAGGWR